MSGLYFTDVSTNSFGIDFEIFPIFFFIIRTAPAADRQEHENLKSQLAAVLKWPLIRQSEIITTNAIDHRTVNEIVNVIATVNIDLDTNINNIQIMSIAVCSSSSSSHSNQIHPLRVRSTKVLRLSSLAKSIIVNLR